MGFYGDRIVPRLQHLVLSHPVFERLRRRYLADVEGDVVEIGFGTGLNLPCYGPRVRRIFAVEPVAQARRLAEPSLKRASIPVEFVPASAEELPLPDRSADAAVTTWTLCSIPRVERALAELRRVLRPGGRLHFVEHGLSADPRVARWQHRLTPLQRRLAGGCHLDRDIPALIEQAGFAFDRLDRFVLPGPRFISTSFAGRASVPLDS